MQYPVAVTSGNREEFSASIMSNVSTQSRNERKFNQLRRRITSQARKGKTCLVTTQYVESEVLDRLVAYNGFTVEQKRIVNKNNNRTTLRLSITW